RGPGSFNLKLENISIKFTLRLGSDTTGKPTISTSNCSARASKVGLRFSGKLKWFYDLFKKADKSLLQKNLETMVCDNVAKSVKNELQTYIQTLPALGQFGWKNHSGKGPVGAGPQQLNMSTRTSTRSRASWPVSAIVGKQDQERAELDDLGGLFQCGPGQRPAWRGFALPAGPDLRHFLRAAAAGQPGPSPELAPEPGSTPAAPKVYLETYGCQMNVSDTEIVWAILQKNGYARTKELAEADVVLLVTCSVRVPCNVAKTLFVPKSLVPKVFLQWRCSQASEVIAHKTEPRHNPHTTNGTLRCH
ncbi:uncharacterized protein LOC121349868, partial [Pyrgilauda ruficollis]|uniref:uncharacterized protein LOC121349868 n=1 Tax=Pyrgilauda ruficollis TaxID=221976 RepID=UPI001B8794FB